MHGFRTSGTVQLPLGVSSGAAQGADDRVARCRARCLEPVHKQRRRPECGGGKIFGLGPGGLAGTMKGHWLTTSHLTNGTTNSPHDTPSLQLHLGEAFLLTGVPTSELVQKVPQRSKTPSISIHISSSVASLMLQEARRT
jgi:hypothetical protein